MFVVGGCVVTADGVGEVVVVEDEAEEGLELQKSFIDLHRGNGLHSGYVS